MNINEVDKELLDLQNEIWEIYRRITKIRNEINPSYGVKHPNADYDVGNPEDEFKDIKDITCGWRND